MQHRDMDDSHIDHPQGKAEDNFTWLTTIFASHVVNQDILNVTVGIDDNSEEGTAQKCTASLDLLHPLYRVRYD